MSEDWHNDPNNLSFGEHLEELRKMLFRSLAVISVFAIAIFCFKDWTFRMLLAPSNWDFVTYRYIEKFLHWLGSSFTFSEYHVNLIATELSSETSARAGRPEPQGASSPLPVPLHPPGLPFPPPVSGGAAGAAGKKLCTGRRHPGGEDPVHPLPHRLQVFRHLQRVRSGGKQHHATLLHRHLHHPDAHHGIGVPAARHRLLPRQDRHREIRLPETLPKACLGHHHGGGRHHHPTRFDDACSGDHPAISAL